MNFIINGFKNLNSSEKEKNAKTYAKNIYHEKQKKELCALHSLNNLFQDNFYTKADLDQICIELCPQEWLNPHRGILGRGNYNINIIIKALHLRDHEAIWFDKRRSVSILNLSRIKGFILNIPSDYKIGGFIPLPWEKKHWIAVSKIEDFYFNLDSKLDEPELIGDENKLILFLENLIKSKDKELFIIVQKDVEIDSSWKLK
ncbi:josephin-2 [Brachionus plicatilis]|uniref:ubiquitinyl hydrolase 1 n=1 Tax=Brachionus plicatilis TaxID=10195 RepID=A0A3M7SWV4_BRAPC|nr:josephin-2 [Brachionus plicatilis]